MASARGRSSSRAAAAARVEELYREHRAMVLAVCRGRLRDHAEADDAAQQTFLSAQRALVNGSLPRDAGAWLAAIARNECVSRARSRPSRPVPVPDEPQAAGPDAHADTVRRETVVELQAALADLPDQQREAILLREVRGLSYAEVAASMAVSTSAVESLIFRARRHLQVRLREAAAAVSPVALLAPLRELAARVAATGIAGPAVAKLAAVGLGTAVVAGGVSADPRLIGIGHAPAPHVATVSPAPRRSAAPPPPVQASPVRPAPVAPSRRTAGIPAHGDAAETAPAASVRDGREAADRVATAGSRGSDGEDSTRRARPPSGATSPVVFAPTTTVASGRDDGAAPPEGSSSGRYPSGGEGDHQSDGGGGND